MFSPNLIVIKQLLTKKNAYRVKKSLDLVFFIKKAIFLITFHISEFPKVEIFSLVIRYSQDSLGFWSKKMFQVYSFTNNLHYFVILKSDRISHKTMPPKTSCNHNSLMKCALINFKNIMAWLGYLFAQHRDNYFKFQLKVIRTVKKYCHS